MPRRMREVAYRRLLARLFNARPEGWVVKGGAALLLRLDPNRTSNDIDIAYLDQAAEHAVALAALQADAALDLGDFFHFEVGAGHLDVVDHPVERAWTAPVTARIGQKEWTTFGIDLVLPSTTINAETPTSITPLVGDATVDGIPGLTLLAIAPQLADKTCAMFERHGTDRAPSSRPRDLADIAMIAQQVDDIDGDELQAALRAEEQRRQHTGSLHQPLPNHLELDPTQERYTRSTEPSDEPSSGRPPLFALRSYSTSTFRRLSIDRARSTASGSGKRRGAADLVWRQLQRSSGCRLRYVNDRSNHSNGPKRARRIHATEKRLSPSQIATANATPATGPVVPKRPTP